MINLCQCSTAFGIDARNLNIALMQPEMEDHMESLGNIGALVGGLGAPVPQLEDGVDSAFGLPICQRGERGFGALFRGIL